ncbi:MAG: hypothetical protein E7641_08340 [Ruminococcaceae bacterium]|nr:hypothetical protein [Oscillospiraceae bacterium]
MIRDENTLLEARVRDLVAKAEKGEPVFTDFLSPGEVRAVGSMARAASREVSCFFFGGYAEAERQRGFFLPEYIESPERFSDIAQFFDGEPVVSLLISGSGYRRLSHRDYLGSLLGLGLERSVLGDIVFTDSENEEAILFCDGVIASFLESELQKIANDKVRVSRICVAEDFVPKRSFAHISDTVASPRLDCVVAAVCSLSREKASAAIRGGLCELEYETAEQPDRAVSAPAVLSVRGYGKFRINSLSERTRKGRLRLDADKYI